jgi:hypothetical protein
MIVIKVFNPWYSALVSTCAAGGATAGRKTRPTTRPERAAKWGAIFDKTSYEIRISDRMELAEQGLDDTGVGVAVEVEREEALATH